MISEVWCQRKFWPHKVCARNQFLKYNFNSLMFPRILICPIFFIFWLSDYEMLSFYLSYIYTYRLCVFLNKVWLCDVDLESQVKLIKALANLKFKITVTLVWKSLNYLLSIASINLRYVVINQYQRWDIDVFLFL